MGHMSRHQSELFLCRSDAEVKISNDDVSSMIQNYKGDWRHPVQQIAAAGNNVYLLGAHSTRGGPIVSFIRSSDNGTSFKSIHHVATLTGGQDIDSPQIVASGNNTHVVWGEHGSVVLYKISLDR
jgi:hypothetical protein